MSDKHNYQKLPPGWDCKYDQATGNCYYVNYITRMMQLEDPRYKQLQNEQCSTESIPMQPLQSSPYHVYPRNNLTAIHAFQSGSLSTNQLCSSPLLSRTYLGERNAHAASKLSVVQTPRLMHADRRQTIQETSFSSNKINTDLIVAKIQNMFPTAGENHIRLLLKKYYNREAVVISALQVEKHPVTMPGPFVTPPAQRHVFHASNERNFHYLHSVPTTRQLEGARIVSSMLDARAHHSRGMRELERMTNTPPSSPYVGDDTWRHSPIITCSSPKMKLRYMKNIFPKAEETFLLDILANAENNVQKASEKLISMGYVKRNFTPLVKSKKMDANELNAKTELENLNLEQKKTNVPKELTTEEKQEMKLRLQAIHSSVAEHIILMALESVNYDEVKALKILQIMRSDTNEQEEKQKAKDIEMMSAKSKCEELETKNIQLQLATTNNTNSNNNLTMDTNKSSEIELNEKRNNNSCLKTQPRKACLFAKMRKTMQIHNTTQDSPHSSTSCSFASGTIASTCILSPISGDKMQQLSSALYKTHLSDMQQINNSDNKIDGSTQTKHCALSSSTYTMSSTSKHCISQSSTTQALDDATKTTTRRITADRNLEMPKNQQRQNFQSLLKRITIQGHNAELAHGPNESLLLADYVTWNGAIAHNAHGHQSDLVSGSDNSLLVERIYVPRGHNNNLCKGPQTSLVKGSIYSAKYTTKNSADIKCN